MGDYEIQKSQNALLVFCYYPNIFSRRIDGELTYLMRFKLFFLVFLMVMTVGCGDRTNKQQEGELYRPIMVTGGRLAADKSDLDASQLEVPVEYLTGRGKEVENGETHGFKLAVLLPDFSPSRPYFEAKGRELKEKYPNEKELNRKQPILRNMSDSLQADFRAIRAEYRERVIEIDVSSPRDIYSLEEGYEGSFSLEKKKKLHARGEYYGPTESRGKRSKLNHFRNGESVSARVGKFGEGLWRYKDGLGRDFINDKPNKKFELWEYAKYQSEESIIPKYFYYVPVVPILPHQLYLYCDWNGNIDFLATTKCTGSSNYDNTIAYSFTFNRTVLPSVDKLNSNVREFIKSLVIEKGRFSALHPSKAMESK